ncbi:MAG: tRNA-dihydrouridine synthase family protein, partial [Akkermansiaceae bacterium]|nr:tRNA-dihydrouridine synthase family protein [Akkermansiaceae bacterium]
MREFLPTRRPALALAPMQDITHLAFMRALVPRSLPDWFVTEFFRVHPDSSLEKPILKAILEHQTGRPVFAQIIGGDAESILRAARQLARYPIAGIDLNLGCPAPVVCRKRAGGGLLRQPERLGELLARLRAGIAGCFTVKTRLGVAEPDEFGRLLDVFLPIGMDGLTVHARTVAQGYQGPVAHGWVREAVRVMPCPVVANGNIVDVATGLAYQRLSGAAGLMVGRGAIRNPWLFAQLRAA